jgi:hypothetical protein
MATVDKNSAEARSILIRAERIEIISPSRRWAINRETLTELILSDPDAEIQRTDNPLVFKVEMGQETFAGIWCRKPCTSMCAECERFGRECEGTEEFSHLLVLEPLYWH